MRLRLHPISAVRSVGLLTALFLGLAAAPRPAVAHGFAGARFFPATLTTDDPFVADEASLPSLQTFHTGDSGGTREFDVSFDIARRLTTFLDIELAIDEVNLFPHEGHNRTGFGNLELGSKFEFFMNEKHEAILSLGLDVTVGGTGSRLVGRDPFTTWSPGLFFGKGFGDLPASLPWLRPLALTGNISVDIPSSASTRSGDGVDRNPVVLETNFALEYSLVYLQHNVKDVGLKAPFDRLIPLVEAVISTPLDRGQSGQTTVSINPGVIWSGRYYQLGVEALIPANARSGSRVGVLAQLHFYLDDLFPSVFGHPLFGGEKITASGNSAPTPGK